VTMPVMMRATLACAALSAAFASSAEIWVTQPEPSSATAYIGHVYECVHSNKLIACPDTTEMDLTVRQKIRFHFEKGAYGEIDKLYDAYRGGTERFKDGRWKLVKLEEAIENGFISRDNWNKDLERLKAWQTQNPKSFIAKFSEASYWRAFAWKARGTAHSKNVENEGWELYQSRLNNALRVLTELYPESKHHPSWYPMMIRVALSMGAEHKQIRSIFDQGQKLFPEYHSIYLAMAVAYEPRWGGSVAIFDQFAHDAASMSAKFEGPGMYARIYWLVDMRGRHPFENSGSVPSWKSLKNGFEALEKRYPNSEHIKNQFAHLACRTDDSALYMRIRNELGILSDVRSFVTTPLDACDAKHGWVNSKK
jgi:Domain of unknown function (DUF4034)